MQDFNSHANIDNWRRIDYTLLISNVRYSVELEYSQLADDLVLIIRLHDKEIGQCTADYYFFVWFCFSF